jgi:hypothetical protein
MQYSVTTTEKNGILQECERNCNLGDAGITGVTTFLADFTNYCNRASRVIWHSIFMAYGGWQYDDSNQTDLPASTATLTASQTSYALPSGNLTIRGIEVKDTSGIWTQLIPLTEEQIRQYQAMGEFNKTAGSPRYYQLVGQTVRIFPASNYTQASSFKVFYDRGSVAFLTTDTTKTPGFAGEYHDLVPLMASYEYLKIKLPNDSLTTRIGNDITLRIQDLKNYYAQNFRQMFPPRMTVRDVMRDAM